MKHELILCGAVAGLTAIAQAAELTDPMAGFAEDRLVALSAIAPISLDESWDIQKLATIGVSYSAEGWGVLEVPEGSVVNLRLALENGSGAKTLNAAPLTGSGTFGWFPENIAKTVYVLTHEVSKAGVLNDAETLVARFSFENCQMEGASMDEIRSAVLQDFSGEIVCANNPDKAKAWGLIGGKGEGLAAPAGEESAFSFAVNGSGSLQFSYRLGSGDMLAIDVDGEPSGLTLTPGETWAEQAVSVFGMGTHTVRFTATATGEQAVALKDVVWRPCDFALAEAGSSVVAVDLREGVRSIRKNTELLPFVYSCTNFTGLAGTSSDSLSTVRLVRLQGTGEDLDGWTEVAGSEVTLISDAPGEGSVVWRGKQGVWKATLVISSGNASDCVGEAILDMRKFGRGIIILFSSSLMGVIR